MKRKGDIVIKTSRFLSNSAEIGGAVAIHTQHQAEGSVIMFQVGFINNSALFGGAVHIAKRFADKIPKGRKIIRDCVFANNTAVTIGQSVFTNCGVTIIDTSVESFERSDTFHVHIEGGSRWQVAMVRNTTLHLYRSVGKFDHW